MKYRMIKMLLVLAAAYTNTPIFSQDANTAVGTPNGTFEVSNLGAAQYHIQIEVPDGGPLMPDVSIDYNSQAGDGLVGYGFSIGGLQCITRGGKDLFHDGVKTGVKYDANDAFFLNGTRLILQSGTYGADGSIYAPEGDPHTIVTLHNSAASTSAWFSVIGKDGKEYEFGNTTDSRYSFTDRKNVSHTAAWYINRVSDSHTNHITYSYTTSNYVIRPTRINYGMNRGITNSVIFNYSTLPAASITKFAIGDRQGILDVCLNSIVTQTGNNVYRTYNFTYNGTSDATALKHYRLTQVDMKNGSGEATSPIKIQWNHLLNPALQSRELNVETKDNSSGIKEQDKSFFAADLNGDGVSDIIRISSVDITDYYGGHHETFVYISRSKVSIRGEVAYHEPIVFKLPLSSSINDLKNVIGGSSVLDMDGDGYNDIIIPFHNQGTGWNNEDFYIIFGSDVSVGGTTSSNFSMPLQAVSETPLFTTLDTDGTGKDDIVCVEQRSINGKYPCFLVKMSGGRKLNASHFTVSLPKNPEKMFSGDYNNDGLTDLIVFYNGGYKIYFNNGGTADALKFTESNVKTGTMQKNCWRIQQGDFDGDGLTDFIYNIDGDTFFWIARNNGDGTFTQTKSDDIGFGEQDGNGKDNSRFSVMVWDMDQDGRSDVMVCKANYEHIKLLGIIKNGWRYKNTYVRCLYSDGTTLKLKKNYTKKREDDADERYIFLGDFDGDGYLELANYGSKLNSTDDTFNEKINVYKSGSALPQRGKVSRIIDGFGNHHTIKYHFATNPFLYKNNRFRGNAVNSYTLPIPVVFSVNRSRGVAGSTTTKYTYEDLLLHLKGKGMLGFNAVQKENSTLKTTETIRITEWDQSQWTPKKIETISTVGDATSRIVAESTVANMGKNYFAYVSNKEITDLDDNIVSIETEYDTAKGVVTKERIDNVGEGMYKMVEYGSYHKIANRWLPSSMTTTQQHSDDEEPYSSETTYTYTAKGDVASTTINSGTPMALKTEYTYDIYGNVTSSVSSGQGVKAVKTLNTYDATRRFVTKTQTSPASAVKTYTHDIWGNMLTECDETDASNKLTTTYTYDGWGRLKTKTTPEGLHTNYETGWTCGDGTSSDANKKYYTKETGTAMPPVTIYYDVFGHELQRDTKGPKNIDITKTTSYNRMGLVSQVENVTGTLLSITDKYTYDTRGRMLSETSSTGKSTTYSYNNRTVTTTTAGRTYTTTTDAWGNIIKSSDPQNEVEYQYFSNGKPSSVTTNGTTVSMTYDVAGNQTSLTDPDAGISTYTYAADGTLLTQTDGRGVDTRFIYDDLGRIESKQVGLSTINYTYGTTGVEKLRLIKETLDDKTVEYTHDKYGRLLEEKRTVGEHGTYTFTHKYNAQGQLSRTVYPGDLTVTYQYDENGYKTQTKAGTAVIYQPTSYDSLRISSSFMGKFTSTRSFNGRGYLQSLKITKKSSVLGQFKTQYEASTGNLLSRQRNGASKETFEYDNLDRLVSVKVGNEETMRMDYADNGNILYKTGIGEYEYNAYDHPHAVTDVEDVDMIFPDRNLSTSFNDFGKIERIIDCAKSIRVPGRLYRRPTPYATMYFEYGLDQERWYSELTLLNKRFLTTIYAGDYEKITNYDEYGDAHIREFYYLDGNAIVIKENGEFKNFLAFTDNIGSILSVIDEEGRRVFDASYDAWGRQTVTKNEIGLRRGYTGHEMLNEFGIINMNGRLYDPLLGRFLSPDNYVQAPDNSQSFNRYSYCLNNPLKYVDPSGESFALAFAIFNVASSMMQASFEGRNVWKAGALSLLSSAASYGIGAAFGNVGSFGNELLRAGAHGLSSGVFNALDGGSFGSGFAAGAISSGIGSFAQGVKMDPGLMLASTTVMGGVAAWATGSDFLAGAMNGLQIGMLNHLQHDGDGGTRLPRDENGDLLGGELQEVVIKPSTNTGLALQGALTIGSGATTFFEHNNYSRTFNHWRGKNGKLYSGLTGRGPNQYTGSRSLAMEKAMKFNRAGKLFGGINMFKSGFEFGSSFYNTGVTLETVRYGIDTAFETIGTFGGIKGFAIDLYYQNVMKNYPLIRMSTERQLIDRANMMQRGLIPVGYPGRSFK